MPKICLNSIFKKSIALFVALVILISTLTVALVTSATDDEVWDGTKDSDISGSGTEADPYLIETPEQLAYIVTANKNNTYKSKYFKLANDIKINDTSKPNWKESARNWVWADFRFVGTFDGDGHTIDGLYFSGSQKRFGLFSFIGDSVVKNVRFKDAYIYNTVSSDAEGCAIVAGQASAQTTFDLIYIDESCYVNAPNTKGVAGIIGRSNQNITISNSAVFGTYLGKSHVGAFFGTHWGGSNNISNCFTAANVPVTTSRTPTVDKVYATVKTSDNWYDKEVTLLTADQMKGEAAKTNLVGLDFENVWKTVDGGYPIIRGQEPTVNKVYWDGSTAENYAGGTGTQADPYIIEDGSQLIKMVKENIVAHSSVSSTQIKYFKITKDIYLNPITAEDMQAAITAAADSSGGSVASWDAKGIKPWNTHTSQSSGFMGAIDGGGHTVYGVYVKSGTYSGLLGNVVGPTKVSDLHVKNSYVYGKCVGGIIGSAYGANTNLEVNRCSVDNVVVECTSGSNKGVRVAGIVGGGESTGKITISNCSVTNTTLKSYHSSYPGIESAILGYIGAAGQGHTVTNCFVDDSAHPLSNATNETHFTTNMGNYVTYSNVYYIRNANDTRAFLATNAKEAQFTVLTKTQMLGDAAKTNMPALDYETVWQTVDGGYPVLRESAATQPTPPPAEEDTVWDGTWVTDFSSFEGSGTPSDPYLIKNGKQLAFAAVKNSTLNGGHCYKLANDIVLNDTSKSNWEATAKSWPQNTALRFVGTLDGDGHTIEGLYINSTAGRLGLFAYVGDATVKNIKFKSASINTNSSVEGVAIVAGQTSATSTFEAIYIDKNSKINAPNATGVGAIAARGYNQGNKAGAIIKNCAVLASIVGKTSVGAFTGTYWAADAFVNINNSFTTANLPLSGNKPLSDSANNYGLVSYEGGTKVLTLDQMKGEAAKTNMTGLDFDTVYQVVENDYPIINLREKAEPPTLPLWDGTKDSNLEGSGTPEAPYLIKTPEQLAAIVTGNNGGAWTGKYFKLANDIRIHDTTKANWKDNARNWVWADFRFVGNFDGDGHTIEGLYFKGNQKRMGLFSYIGDTLIKNVKFTGAYIENTTSEEGQAIVAAQASAMADFEGIYIDETCVIKAPNVKGVAGIIGRSNQNVSIKDSAVLGTFTGSSHVGAFFGTFWGGSQSISNCFTASNAPVTASRTPIVSSVYATVSEGYYDRAVTIISAAQMKGTQAATNMSELDFETVFELTENSYPVINIRASAPLEPIPEGVWDGSVADSFAGGTGSPTSPFLIENGAQLRLMLEKYSTYETSSGVYFKLTKDIYLSNVLDGTPVSEVKNKKNWLEGYGSTVPAGSKVNSFNGSFDGNGHVIYGMYIKGAYSAGLFPAISGQAEIKNLGMENILITGGNGFAGAIAGQAFYYSNAKGSAKISYCYVTDAIIGQDANVESAAGFIGATVDGSINFKDCYSYNLSLSCWPSKGLPGGFTGTAWNGGTLNFENCFTVGYFITNQNVNKAVCTNVYTDTARPEGNTTEGVTVLTTAKMKGSAAKTNLKGFNFENDWAVTTDSYPVLREGAGKWQYDATTEAGKVWNGKIALTYAGGTGTEADPFIIKTGGQLALLANEAIEGKTAGKHYKLAADIILNDTSKAGWESRANGWFTGGWDQGFKGHLDGDYHVVSGLFYNNTHETYTHEGTRNAGLFASLSVGAVVEKLGIVNSSLTHTHATAGRRLGAIAGYIDHYNGDNTPYEQYPIIRECFADTSVYLSGGTCGGLVGGVLRPVRVEDSFFTGTVAGTGYGIFGYSKMGYLTDEVLIKNVYAAHSDYAVVSNTSYDNVVYENCYSSSAQDTEGVKRLFIDRMCGDLAKEYMTTLDFNKVWRVGGEKETPGLRGFKETAYNNVMNPQDITVSFETNCDLLVESIKGKAYSKLELPTLEREGYIFEGWYSYPELDAPYAYDYFPSFNTILYAKWTLDGYYQDFEDYDNSIYDYHEGIEYYRPTTAGYTALYVRSGAKSIHRLGGINDYLDFLLFYDKELEVGKTYKMVFYTTTDQDTASTKLSLVHLDWPDVYDNSVAIDEIGTLESIVNGEWVEHTFTFTAKAKWIAIRTEGEDSVFFDDFTLYRSTDKVDAPQKDKDTDAKSEAKEDSNLLLIIIIAAAAVVVLAGGATAAVVIIKKRKK